MSVYTFPLLRPQPDRSHSRHHRKNIVINVPMNAIRNNRRHQMGQTIRYPNYLENTEHEIILCLII